MYKKYFGLKTKPFEIVPNPDFLFLSRSHRKALTYLDYGIREKIGFVLLTGEVGSGKTTLIRDLIKRIDGDVTLSKVFNTKVNSEQLIAMINDDFNLDIRGKDKVLLWKELNDFLIDQYARGNHPVLIIDEAQNLDSGLLEEVRLLSNLETDSAKLLQIILVGQPELRKTLAMPELMQLRQRISISYHIFPLTLKETEDYILHRLEIAGNRNAVEFSGEVLEIVHGFSRGIPRLINTVCDFLMLSAFAEGHRELSAELAGGVVEELEMENGFWQDADKDHSNGDGDLAGRLERMEEEISTLREDGRWRALSERISELEKTLKEHIDNREIIIR